MGRVLLLQLPQVLQVTVKITCWLAWPMTAAGQTHLHWVLVLQLPQALLLLLLLLQATVMATCWLGWHMTVACQTRPNCWVLQQQLPQALRASALPLLQQQQWRQQHQPTVMRTCCLAC
jgi:hypothetical protein